MITRHKHWTAPLRLVALWVLLLGGVMPALASARLAGPIDPLALNALLTDQMTKLTAADGAANEGFGQSVSVSGDIAVIGAFRDDAGRGAAYVFYRNQGGVDAWGQVAKLTASDGVANDHLGVYVGVSGDTIVVGADWADASGTDSGAAYVFYRNQGGVDAWGQVAKLTAGDGAADDWFGHSVAIHGDTIVVGARADDSSRGSAYVFERDQGGVDAWGQVRKLTASDGLVSDCFGRSVSVNGDTIVVGAEQDDSARGAAYIFDRDQDGADAWGQVVKLVAADRAAGDEFGMRVSVNGDTVVVGARHDDDNGADSGSAYIFYRNQGGANAWGQVDKLTAADGAAGDVFGHTVAVSGDVVVVGAHGDNSAQGSAYVFERNEGGTDQWGQVDKLTAADGATSDRFGTSVSVNGGTIVAGAEGDDSEQGSAYIYYQAYKSPDLALAKSVAPAVAAPGQTITYTLSFSNAGVVTATGVVLTDTLPASVTSVTVLSSGVSITQRMGMRYVWDVADLAPGVGGIITLTCVLDEPLAAGIVTNTATIAATNVETITLNNSDNAALAVLNVAPTADDDSYATGVNSPLAVPAGTGVLDGDGDANGDPLTAVLDTDVMTGTLVLSGDGSFVYTPLPGWSGLVTFTYHATDGTLDSNIATVTIAVAGGGRIMYLPLVMNHHCYPYCP